MFVLQSILFFKKRIDKHFKVARIAIWVPVPSRCLFIWLENCIWMNLKWHLQSSRSVWAFFDQFNIYWTLSYVSLNILAFFCYPLKTDHFFWRENFPYPNFNSFMHIKSPNWPPLKLFLVVIIRNKVRILNRIHRRIQRALNLFKIWLTNLELSLDCQTIFIWLSVMLHGTRTPVYI